MSSHHNSCTYEYGKGIEEGTISSWSDERQREKYEDAFREYETNEDRWMITDEFT